VLPLGELTCTKLAIVRAVHKNCTLFWRSLKVSSFCPFVAWLLIALQNNSFLLNFYDVTWPRHVKLVTPMRLEPDISKTAGDRLHSKEPPIENGLWGIKRSGNWCRHMTPKGQTRDPNMLRAQLCRKQLEMLFSKSLINRQSAVRQTVYPSDSLASCSIYKNLIHSFILHYLTFKKLQKALNSVKI